MDSVHFTVFGTDWGRHPDSLQQIFLNLSGSPTIEWVGSVGMRPPQLSRTDLIRIATRVALMPQSTLAGKSTKLNRLIKPVVLPWHHLQPVRWLNRRLLLPRLRKQLSLPDDGVIVTMYPTADLFAREFPAELRVAYVADDYSEMPGVQTEFIRGLERDWIEGSDIVFASATTLVARYRAWGHSDVRLLAHGVNVDAFLDAEPSGTGIPADLGSPVIGFLGAISPWVDLDLIGDVADHFPEATVLLVGPVDTDETELDRLRTRPNVALYGPVSFKHVPGVMKCFDVGIIPFARSPLMDSVNPLKLLEYLAIGLPVVSTPMGDIEEIDGAIGIGVDSESFIRCIEKSLQSGKADSLVRKRIELARQRSWRAVASEFQGIVGERLKRT